MGQEKDKSILPFSLVCSPSIKSSVKKASERASKSESEVIRMFLDWTLDNPPKDVTPNFASGTLHMTFILPAPLRGGLEKLSVARGWSLGRFIHSVMVQDFGTWETKVLPRQLKVARNTTRAF